MTAIEKHEKGPEPPQTYAGYVWPGLGHLLVGEYVHGVGIMSVSALIGLSAILGLPSLGSPLMWLPVLGLLFPITLAYCFDPQLMYGRRIDPTSPLGQRAGAFGIALLGVLGTIIVLLGPTVVPILDADANLTLHQMIALVALPITAAVLFYRAHRRVFPKELSEEEYNSNRNMFLRQIRRHRSGMLGFYGICLLLLAMVVTPMLAPFDPDLIDAGPATVAPGWWQHVAPMIGWSQEAATHGFLDYPMGTDERGRDVLSRLLFGARISLLIGFFAVSLAASIGTVVGATAGYLGGWADRTLMWFVDLLLAMPRLILLLAVVGIIDLGGTKRLFLIIGVLGLTGWMGVSRIVRSQVLSLKQQDFIQAARALGYSQVRIVLQHLIPNAMAPVIVFCSLAIGGTMLAEAGLSFLGLGVQPPTSTWGVMVNEGRPTLRDAPWISLFPGLAIVAAVMCFNLLGDGLRDALDPKQRT